MLLIKVDSTGQKMVSFEPSRVKIQHTNCSSQQQHSSSHFLELPDEEEGREDPSSSLLPKAQLVGKLTNKSNSSTVCVVVVV